MKNINQHIRKITTETALLRIKNDIIQAMDDQCVVCLVLLDGSSAFDLVSHSKLVERLEKQFAVTGKALDWISSYISGRKQRVVIGDLSLDGVVSEPEIIKQGVPQGSVLGPLIFTLYVTPIGDICRKHNKLFQQIYMALKNCISQDHCIELENCMVSWP